jgi:adenosylcobinamide amidohydrolase
MTDIERQKWERLRTEPHFELRRAGRYVVAELNGAHQVISTSVRHGGWAEHVGWLVNHQSCEGTAHVDRHRVITESGMEAYHDRVCAELGLPPEHTAVMGTAANMNYVAIVREVDEDVAVTAAVRRTKEFRRFPRTPAPSTPCSSSVARSCLPLWRV